MKQIKLRLESLERRRWDVDACAVLGPDEEHGGWCMRPGRGRARHFDTMDEGIEYFHERMKGRKTKNEPVLIIWDVNGEEDR